MDTALPGFERLISTCRRYQLPLELSPAIEDAPLAAELFLGQPLDPVLATLYGRVGQSRIGDFSLYGPSSGEYGLRWMNELYRNDGREPFLQSLVFGQLPSLAYRFAVVPRLADEHGIQPVIFIDDHLEKQVLPVASSVDRFFDAYARALEDFARISDEQYRDWNDMDYPPPAPEFLAEDTALVKLLEAGRFDGLVSTDPESQEWIRRVLTLGLEAAPR
ncbi:hypothetical protein ACLESO_25435 [Pyxidicoccus sp. 3LG]